MASSFGHHPMRPLVIGVFAATLAGCAPQIQQASLTESQIDYSKHVVLDHDSTAKAKKAVAAKKRSQYRKKANTYTKHAHAKNAKSNVNIKSAIAKAPHDDNDAVIKKAKATIAAKMEDPKSVEFSKMKRVAGKDALGNSIESICGYVTEKNASVENTGNWQFLYIVQEDKAYVGHSVIATTPYRHICS